MKKRPVLALTTVFAMLAVAACADPMEGEWESDRNACGERSDFTVDDELQAKGTAWFVVAGGCQRCDFDATLEDRGDGRYDIEVDFDDCVCPTNGSKSADGECKLNSDETRVDCELDFCGVTWEEDFDKLE